MLNSHPKLIEIVVLQTPRTMAIMLLVSLTYIVAFSQFIPWTILLVWFCLQFFCAVFRIQNARMLSKYLQNGQDKLVNRQESFLTLFTLIQSVLWVVASLLVSFYAPQPYELLMLIVVVGLITGSVLSMSSLYNTFLLFFFSMIVPQFIIMFYHGGHEHFTLMFLLLIFIPAIMFLSKSMLTTRIDSIEAHQQLEKSAKEFEQLAITDNLTNIYNRRYFFEMAENNILSAYREHKKVSLLMLDIDYFKQINDNYGHQCGDVMLQKLVEEIKNIIRKSDVFARLGGEEFVLLLNDTDYQEAKVIAEKIRLAIENKVFIINDYRIKITISIGFCELNKQNMKVEDLYKQADKQLYLAKEQGRNRVCP